MQGWGGGPERASQGGRWHEGLFGVSSEQTVSSHSSPGLSALPPVSLFLAFGLCWDSALGQPRLVGSSGLSFVSLLLSFPLGVSPVQFLFLWDFLPLLLPWALRFSCCCVSGLGLPCAGPRVISSGCPGGTRSPPCRLSVALDDTGSFSWGQRKQWLWGASPGPLSACLCLLRAEGPFPPVRRTPEPSEVGGWLEEEGRDQGPFPGSVLSFSSPFPTRR